MNHAEIVLFRFTLQHLKSPLLALQHASHYLYPNGYVLIIDSCDSAKRTSHNISAIDEALELVAKHQKNNGKGNRRITLEILEMLENQQSTLSELYEVSFSNLDVTGNVLDETIRIDGEKSRKLYFNQGLLFLTLLQRTYQIPVDLNKGYDELKEYLEDENAWTVFGTHCLVLKKK